MGQSDRLVDVAGGRCDSGHGPLGVGDPHGLAVCPVGSEAFTDGRFGLVLARLASPRMLGPY